MKLLILVDWYRPAYRAGGPIKSIYYISKILQGEVGVNIITGDRDLGDTHAFTDVQLNKWTRRETSNVLYIEKAWWNVLRLIRGMKDIQADAIYINGIFSWFFNLLPLCIFKVLNLEGKLIISPRGMLQEGALSLKSNKKQAYLKVFKMFLPTSIVFHATDQQESKDIQRQLGIAKSKIVVVGNLPGPVMEEAFQTKLDVPIRLVLLSRLDKKKNVDGLLEELRGVTCNADLDIYGSFQNRIYQKRCHVIAKELPNNITVRFLGELHPSRVRNVLADYHFYILLTHGENFGHSIFEAMSVGLPIIISQRTPWTYVCSNGGGIVWTKTGDLPDIISSLVKLKQDEYDLMRSKVLKEAQSYIDAKNYSEEYYNLFFE